MAQQPTNEAKQRASLQSEQKAEMFRSVDTLRQRTSAAKMTTPNEEPRPRHTVNCTNRAPHHVSVPESGNNARKSDVQHRQRRAEKEQVRQELQVTDGGFAQRTTREKSKQQPRTSTSSWFSTVGTGRSTPTQIEQKTTTKAQIVPIATARHTQHTRVTQSEAPQGHTAGKRPRGIRKE